MHPGFLFPNIEASSWDYLKLINENPPPWINVICKCHFDVKIKPEHGPVTIEAVNKGRIEVRPIQFTRNDEDVIIYIGQCKDCKRVYWTAWQFEWLMWMAPQQQWEMLLSESRNAQYRVEHGERTRIVVMDKSWFMSKKREFTIIFNRDGDVEYLTYHNYEY